MLGCLPFSIIGYAIIANTNNVHVKYGATFLMASGLYTSVPPVLVWINNNSSPHYKRATAQGLQLAIANCGGFVATFLYPAAQAPAYQQVSTFIFLIFRKIRLRETNFFSFSLSLFRSLTLLS